MKRIGVAVAAAAILWAGSAHSAIIQVTGTFFASGFQPFNGPVPAPFDNISGQFKLQYDDQVPGTGDLLSFSMDLGAVHYSRFNTGTFWHTISPPGDRRIRIGGLLNGVSGGSPGTDDFAIGMDFDGDVWLSGFLTYNSSLVSPSTRTSSFSAGSLSFQPGDFTASVQVSEAPLPGALPLMAGALGATRLAGWARRCTRK